MARCTVARLMRDLGLDGARRGKKIRTTVRDDAHDRAADLLFNVVQGERCAVIHR